MTCMVWKNPGNCGGTGINDMSLNAQPCNAPGAWFFVGAAIIAVLAVMKRSPGGNRLVGGVR